MIDVEKVLSQRFPELFADRVQILGKALVVAARRLFREQDINQFLNQHRGVEGLDFVERVLDYFEFSYTASNRQRENIPSQGRVVIIANHPLGALDALALVRLVSEVRRDIRVVANDLLVQLEPLRPLLLPVDNLGLATGRDDIRRIQDALLAEQAVILFPAGEVSRIRPSGVRDGRWSDGFLRFAQRAESPVLPVYIHARNSSLFYGVSMIYKPLAALLLVREMFLQRSNTIRFTVGELIPQHSLNLPRLTRKTRLRLVQRHLHRIARGKKGIFETERSIAQPEPRQALKKELQLSPRIGETRDGKAIHLVDHRPDSALMGEIARLREFTFRKVGEGTGRKRDGDSYDQSYRHILLWDEDALEVVGSYRLGEAAEILDQQGPEGLYTASLFEFTDAFLPIAEQGLELGRSFVQPAYWGSRALDYLWQGIGAYLRCHPEIRYLFGPVSISQQFPPDARDLLIGYYLRYHGANPSLVGARNPISTSESRRELEKALFDELDAEQAFAVLKERLADYGLAVPTLYKQYTDLCEPGGAQFHAFSQDPSFNNCVDGFILVDLARLKPRKRARYLQ